MHRFNVIPTHCACAPFFFESEHICDVLKAMSRKECRMADIYQEQHYCFTLEHSEEGGWFVFDRFDPDGPKMRADL